MQSVKKIIFKILKITGITLGSILLLMFLLPVLFPTKVSNTIKKWANSSITGELNFSKARLSFFNHFPALTLTLYNVSLKGSAPFKKDTLLAAHEVALGVDLTSIFTKRININQIFLTEADIHILADVNGAANYNVYVADTTGKAATTNDSSSASLKIEKIEIDHSNLIYDDRSFPMLITAKELNYIGKGDLSKEVFDLSSHILIDSFDLDYNHNHYIGSKKLSADLITKINTGSLAFIFEKNDLKLNSLPVKFIGNFKFLKNGYDMSFKLQSTETDLYNILSALPPDYMHWLDSTDVNGFGDINATLRGKYIAETATMPDLAFNMKIRDGSIDFSKSPSPLKNLYVNFQAKMPGLNPDSLYVNLDSLYFNIDKDHFSSIIKVKGIKEPQVHAKIIGDIDLEKWDRALGIQPFDVKGKYSIQLFADGKYATGVVKKGLRQVDTVITSIPQFSLQSSLQNGYFKLAALPQPVSDISFNLNAACRDNNYKHASLSLDNLHAAVLTNYIKGFFKLGNAGDFPINAGLQSVLHLADIKKFYPLESMSLDGDLNIDIHSKGNYLPAKKLFPVTKANLSLKNGSVLSKYYPHPIKNIQVGAQVVSDNGSMKDLHISITPVSFTFEDQPFTLTADLKNFENLKYNIKSNGIIDIGKIYQVFSKKGYDVKGTIQTDLSLQGLQSDATAGRYSKLMNKGNLKLKNISLSSDLFPQPFYIKNGLFRFDQDKMWFDQFNANYGKTNIILNGYLNNVINYAMEKTAPLRGNFDMNTDYFLVDEFMAFADSNTKSTNAKANAPAGVVLVPNNLAVTFNAAANTVHYNGIDLKNFKGQMVIDSGRIKLNKTGFTLIDAPVVMDATYGSLSPQKAFFDYHIDAQNFDIKKAYNEIKLFHDMATSASKAEGIVSLNYQLSGKLDNNMHPIYPSLKGEGVLSLQKVKVKGLKLFGAVSSATNHEKVNNPDLSKVNIKTKIANNIITIERTKMRVAGFRPRIEGQASFDGQLNLKFRLGLPPFGIFGIPITVTGTQENPKIKLRRGNASDSLHQTLDKDDTEKEE